MSSAPISNHPIPRKEKTYLQNSQFMHILSPTSRNHVFESRKLLIHFRSAATLNQAVGCFPGRFATRPGFLFARIGRGGNSVFLFLVVFGPLLVLGLGFHLDDFASTRRWRRKFEVVEASFGPGSDWIVSCGGSRGSTSAW